MNRKSMVGGVVLIVSLACVGVALAAWKIAGIRASMNAPGFEPPEFVESVTVKTASWQPRTRLVGTVFAIRSVTLANESLGVVTEVGFDSGEVVEAGQVLLRLDTSTEEADLAASEAAERLAVAGIDVARANIRVGEANLTLAQNNHRRMHDAAANQSASASEIDRVNAELDRATADLERERSTLLRAEAERDQASARVRQIQSLIDKKTLKAPFRARAGIRTVHPGQYLSEGTEIVGLTEITDDIYVDFAVPQEYAARVSPGTVVIASSDVLESDSVPITVVSIDATVNSTTRNVRVRSRIANPEQRLKPGMFMDVDVPVESASERTVVPATAIRRASFGDHVFVLVPGDAEKDPPGALRARQRMVTLGAHTDEGLVIVLSGLDPGERIAADGSFKLREGALVMLNPPAVVQEAEATPTPEESVASN